MRSFVNWHFTIICSFYCKCLAKEHERRRKKDRQTKEYNQMLLFSWTNINTKKYLYIFTHMRWKRPKERKSVVCCEFIIVYVIITVSANPVEFNTKFQNFWHLTYYIDWISATIQNNKLIFNKSLMNWNIFEEKKYRLN